MQMNSVNDIETQLQRLLVGDGLISADTQWCEQTGGRTNKVWRLTGDLDLICKLYLDASQNPLYANTPLAEYECLRALDGAHVAPAAHGFVETDLGPVLLYHYIEGRVWDGDATEVADLLSRVHTLAPPKNLRILSGDVIDVAAQGLSILDKVNDRHGVELRALRPDVSVVSTPHVLIHTDVVAGNLIYGADGLRLIDWQCPAFGDPVVDVAMFLSPAMHMIYGSSPLSGGERDAFLNAINPDLRARYHNVGMLYHWRMAAYCLWRAAQGQVGYNDAAQLEMALLE
jgi:aminoglycoside phosphotransferase (APT) family kinase protein